MELSFDSIDTPALTKAQLAKLLFEQIGLNKREAKDFIDAFFDLVVSQLVDGRDAKISGYGHAFTWPQPKDRWKRDHTLKASSYFQG